MSPRSSFPLKLGYSVLFILIIILVSSKVLSGPFLAHQPLVNPGAVKGINITSTFSFIFKSPGLSKIIQKNLADQKGDYAVYIYDLTDGEVYSLKQSDRFPAASLYKLFLLAAVLKEVDNGAILMEDTISADKKHLEEVFGDTDFGYEETEGDIKYTIEEALTRVGRISDNFAAIMLAEKIGWKKVQGMADSLGAENTIIKSPITTSAADIGKFYQLLYQKQVVNVAVSEKVIEFLALSKIENRIPAKLPQDVKIVHKTGELDRVRHDGGIIYLDGRPYILVMMSKDLQYEDDGVETLAQISKDVYEYFANKGK